MIAAAAILIADSFLDMIDAAAIRKIPSKGHRRALIGLLAAAAAAAAAAAEENFLHRWALCS